MSFDRISRISEEVKRAISDIIRDELKDPRISKIVSIMSANVTRDLRYAKVFISVYGSEEEKISTLKALKSAAGFIRREVGNRVDLRYTPEIIFELDNSIEYGIHISEVIKSMNKNNGE